MVENAANGSVDLRHAAKAVSVLNARVVGDMRFANLAPRKKIAEIGCGGDLTSVWTRQMNAGVESDRRTHQRLKRHGSRKISGAYETAGVGNREHADGGHGLGAVEQCEALLGSQRKRDESCGG